MMQPDRTQVLPNGAGAAALVAAGLGGLVLAVLAVIADHSPAFKNMLVFSAPVGALSGESTCAVAVWLGTWAMLDLVWKRRNVWPGWIYVGVGLLFLGFVLTAPPVADFF